MSHPNNTGNGCSLEDCHTNLFALADLAGIKWRKMKNDNQFVVDPMDDPVLLSFMRCIQQDILCVWQRVKPSGVEPKGSVDQLSCNKELWIFWYGDEPNNMSALIAPELQVAECGSWDNGLSYECRSLLFKALHNLIERCLLSQNFVRLGKWFVQPFDHLPRSSTYDKSAHLSIQFSFFLHGESTVCTSIDVRQHPPLWRLESYHLTVASQQQGSQQGLPVILAPYGLQGTLTGHVYKESDPTTQKILEDWKHFYVVPDPETWECGDQSAVPRVVEVVVAGVRMRYPSSYVMITGETEADIIRQHGGTVPISPTLNSANPAQLNRPVSPTTANTNLNKALTGHSDPEFDPAINSVGGDVLNDRLLTKMYQDGSVTSGVHTQSRHQTSDTGEGDVTIGQWEYGEPLQKNSCACNKVKGQKKSSTSSSSQNQGRTSPHGKPSGDKVEKSEKERRKNNTPYHRRNMQNDQDFLMARDIDMMMQSLPARSVGTYKGNPSSGGGSNSNQSGNGSTTGVGSSTQGRSLQTSNSFEGGADSPHSAAPSPLIANQIHPSVNPNGDPTMPTLSPQPVTKIEKDLNTSTGSQHTGENGDNAAGHVNSTASVHNNQNTLVNGTTDPAHRTPSGAGIQIKTEQIFQTLPVANNADFHKVEIINTWLESQQQKRGELKSLKRPVLPKQGYETLDLEEMNVESLYNFESLNAWLDYPIKRKRTDSERKFLSPTGNNNLAPPGTKMNGPSPSSKTNHDPYEFSEEASLGTGSLGKRGPLRSSQDVLSSEKPIANGFGDEESITFRGEPKSIGDLSPTSPSIGGSGAMLTEKDLAPKYDDLQKMFDTSDSDNDDNDPFPLPSPPKSVEDRQTLQNGSCKATNLGSSFHYPPTVTELSKMFPTPPSLENAHNLSPGQGMDGMTDVYSIPSEPCTVTQMDTTVARIVHQEEPLKISDYSYVYKPPTVSTFVSSNKYAPIELPSVTMEPLRVSIINPYRPSWQQFQMQMIDNKQPQRQQSHYNPALPTTDSVASLVTTTSSSRHTTASVETSPATTGGGPRSAQQHTPRTPMSYVDLQSPASNASSYMNNLRSIDNQPTNSSMPEVNSIVVNIMLYDSLLNLFKDQNFDSCTICVCNTNIRGADYGLYLPDKSGESQYRCTCGFSAVVNRKYGANSGLFYEDEVDITGIRDERLEQRKPNLLTLLSKDSASSKNSDVPEVLPQDLLMLLTGQFTTIYPSYTVSRYCGETNTSLLPLPMEKFNMLEIQDGCEACYNSLEVGRQAMDNCTSSKLEDPHLKRTCIHRWPYLQTTTKIPSNSEDTLRLLRSLLPLLEDAIQKKRTSRVWESVYRITGPLSWKDFHLLSGRGSDEASEPQPVPPVLVGYDKELLTLSPYALPYWDKFLLEPYGKQRDIAYLVVSPDNDFVLTHTKTFFVDLCREYELCRLGRHRPIAKVIRDGILRVGKKAASSLANEPIDDWFKSLGDTPLAAKLRLYALVCRHQLAPILSQQGTLDKKDIFEEVNNRAAGSTHSPGSGGGGSSQSSGASSQQQQQPRPSPAPPSQAPSPAAPRTPEDSENKEQDDKDDSGNSSQKEGSQDNEHENDTSETPSVVIYIVDPFCYGNEWPELPRLAWLGLLRCYHETLRYLPEHLQNNVHLQTIPLESIMEYRDSGDSEPLRSLAMSVHTQCRRLVTHTVIGRTLTGFGPAATVQDKVLKSEPGKTSTIRLYSPPYVIAPPRGPQKALDILRQDHTNVLFCGYCLSEDQRWLLGVCTDSKGEILETCTLNIEIPNRNRRKMVSARKIGLQKLWDFIVGLISMTAQSWRIVIGRFGRIGHGELKGWGCLLSKKNLQRTTKQMKEMCNMCGLLSSKLMPSIQSACLVSMELHANIHIMADTLKIEERQSSRIQLTTPRDASVTHILVMPTSSMAAASQAGTSDDDGPQDTNPNLDDDYLDDDFNIGELGGDLIGELGDLFSDIIGGDNNPYGDHKQQGGTTSPTQLPGGRHSPTMGGHMKGGQSGSTSDSQDEHVNLLQQPLAMGFYVSTAKTGPLPKWFWSSCPEKENMCPVCFKAALHVNCPDVEQSRDDFRQQSHPKSSHPLDSNATCDVLRYVLETYNSLSWLTMDLSTNDRRSCLPIHFTVLMQLYHAFNRFI